MSGSIPLSLPGRIKEEYEPLFLLSLIDAESDRGLTVSAPIDIDRDNTKTNIEAFSTENVPRNPCIACQEIWNQMESTRSLYFM